MHNELSSSRNTTASIFFNMNKSILFGLLFVFCISNSEKVFASTDSTDINNLDLEEVVVTAQYAPQSTARSLHKITIIDRAQIELSASQNLKDVLRTELNIRLSQDNILGSSLSLQGVSGENVKILIDGVPVIGRQDGNIDLSQINLNNIERIEIVEGPLSVNYGTNALAGVINLITKKKQSSSINTGIQTYYESIGQYNVSSNIGLQKNKQQLALSIGRTYFDGWKNGEKLELIPSAKLADSNRVMEWKPKEQVFGDWQYIKSFNQSEVIYRGSLFNEKILNAGKPRSPYFETAFDDYYFTNRFDNSIQYNKKFKNNKSLNLIIAYNMYERIKNTYYKDLTILTKQLTTNQEDQDTSSFDLLTSRGTWNSNHSHKKLNYELGYDVSVENASGKRIENNHKSIGDFAIFHSVQYSPIESITIKPGVRFAYNTEYKSPIIPSINIKYQITNRSTIRVSYARGFRSPSLKELYFYFVDVNHNIVGNSDLKAERSNNYIIAYTYLKVTSKTAYKAEPSVFRNDISNLITLAQKTNSEYTYINIGNFKTQGIQLNNSLTISEYKASLGISYTGRYNQISEENKIEKFSYAAEIKFNIQREWQKQNMNFAIYYKYSGKLPQFIIDPATDQAIKTWMGDYHTMDMVISKRFFKKTVNCSIGAKNVFDVKRVTSFNSESAHSSASSSTPIAMGRSYFLKLDYSFSK